MNGEQLQIYIDNDYALYQQKSAIEKMLKRRLAKGTYDPKKAPKAFMWVVDAGAQKYCKEFRCSVRTTFPKRVVREPVAEDYARTFEAETALSNPRRGRGRVNPMTKAQAWAEFKAAILPGIKAREAEGTGRADKPMRREAWNDYTDMLHRDGLITDHQVQTWTHPAGLETNPKHTRPEKPRRKKRKTGRPSKPYGRERKGGGKRKNPISVRSLVARALK